MCLGQLEPQKDGLVEGRSGFRERQDIAYNPSITPSPRQLALVSSTELRPY